jgi:hypothetical protein
MATFYYSIFLLYTSSVLTFKYTLTRSSVLFYPSLLPNYVIAAGQPRELVRLLIASLSLNALQPIRRSPSFCTKVTPSLWLFSLFVTI